MAKVNSPTTNLFAILADPRATDSLRDDNNATKAKTTNASNAETELTPKERAAAKAAENAAKAARRQAERERKALEAEQKKAFEAIPDEGFSKQRTQRIKEQHTAKRNVEATPTVKEVKTEGKTEKTKGTKGTKGAKGPKGNNNNNNNNNSGQTQAAKQWKNFAKDIIADDGNVTKPAKDPQAPKPPKTNTGKGPKREFDKHSAGKTGRQPVAKKDGSGKRNWGKDVPPEATTTETAAALSALNDDDGDVGTVVPTEEKPAQTEAAEGEAADGEQSEEVDGQTLDEYLASRAEQKLALAALIGSRDRPREFTEEEIKSHNNFILVENVKQVEPKESKAASTTAKPATNTTARKGEKAVAVNEILNVRVPPVRESTGRGRGGRGRGGNRSGEHSAGEGASEKPKQQKPKDAARGGNANRGRGQGRRVKINQHSHEQFPSLGKA